ncbi:MAG: dihydrodipicolinate reductase C-terminal domain-containing protein [Dehalococcoidales bacterium]|nr:dihydrodipicolinate reductase C-terminal domain-containing protein [Dehalococcoidales bacterium]
MRIGLFGFGRAGKAVATVLLQRHNISLGWVIRKSKVLEHRSVPEFLGITAEDTGYIFPRDEWSPQRLFNEHPVDVIIDFSSAEAVFYYGEEAADRNIAIVSAISEYPGKTIEFLNKLSCKTRVLWSPNITVGINFMMLAAKILKTIAPYTDIEIIEEHFKTKNEVSGTAKAIARTLSLQEESIKSIRAGGIIGRHEILFGFPYQTVRLIHESITREAFGNGALFAAENLVTKENGLYSMEDLLIPYFRLF